MQAVARLQDADGKLSREDIDAIVKHLEKADPQL
jgi:hypothetical protein